MKRGVVASKMLEWKRFQMPKVAGSRFVTFRLRPVTKASGKSRVVQFRFSCNKIMRHAAYWLAFVSLNRSEWANHYYRDQRAKGPVIPKP
ncbi:MAG: hypothetical protein ACREP8_13290 [Candidatus Binatia bacterium]